MSTKGPRARCPPAPSRVFSYDGPREVSHLPTKPRRLPPPSNLSRVPSAYIIKLASSTEASESIFPPGLGSPHFLFPSSHSPRTHIRPPSHKHYTPTFHDSGSFSACAEAPRAVPSCSLSSPGEPLPFLKTQLRYYEAFPAHPQTNIGVHPPALWSPSFKRL